MTLPAVPLPAATVDAEEADLPRLGSTIRLALTTVLLLLAGLVGWSMFAHLDSAVVAPGTVVADSRSKTVQNLEGGILAELLVREGDRVRAGQPVARLDTTRAAADVEQIADQLLAANARLARLEAEAAGLRVLSFAPDLDPDAAPLATQRALFTARWDAFDGQLAVLEKQIEQHRNAGDAAERQLASLRRQTELFQEEREGVAYLLQKGHERRPRLLELERNLATLEGRRSELQQTVANSAKAIEEARLQIANVRHEREAGVADEIDRTQVLAADLGSRLRAARDVLERRTIRTPQDGIVASIRLVTPGGVILPGDPLMDIVPADDEMIIETRLPTDKVDNVRIGQTAQVRLTAFKRSVVPLVDGEVVYVAADASTDPRSGEAWFVARIRLDRREMVRHPGVVLSPGMPADVMILTGERRAAAYFLEPFAEHLRHAFREE